MSYLLGLFRHAQACPRFPKIKQQYLREGLSYFVYLLHVVTHQWKLQCYHVVLVGYAPACPKLSETTNHQYLWKRSSDFVDFLQVVVCLLLDIHCSYKICYFGQALSGIASQPIRLSDVLNLKNSRTIWGIKLIFCFHWSYKKYHAIFGYDPKILLANQFAGFFTFNLFNLLNLIPGIQYYIVLAYFMRGIRFCNICYLV